MKTEGRVDFEDRIIRRLARETVVLKGGTDGLNEHAAAFLQGKVRQSTLCGLS